MADTLKKLDNKYVNYNLLHVFFRFSLAQLLFLLLICPKYTMCISAVAEMFNHVSFGSKFDNGIFLKVPCPPKIKPSEKDRKSEKRFELAANFHKENNKKKWWQIQMWRY